MVSWFVFLAVARRPLRCTVVVTEPLPSDWLHPVEQCKPARRKSGPKSTQIRCDRRDHDYVDIGERLGALRDDRLFFAFQPVVCAATAMVDYFECLLRMREPEGSIVAGGEFITII